MQDPERRRDDARLIRLEKATDTLDSFMRAKDREDSVRLAILAERLEVLTILVRDQLAATNEQFKQIKLESQRMHDTTSWFSMSWKILAGALAFAGAIIAMLKAIRVIP